MEQFDLTDTLGFFFVVFQRTLSGNYVKCFIDGDSDYTFIEIDTLVEMTQKKGYNPIMNQILDCLNTTGMYIWDVYHNTIQRLSPSSTPDDSMSELIKGKMEEIVSERNKSSATTTFDISNPFLKRTKEGILSLFR